MDHLTAQSGDRIVVVNLLTYYAGITGTLRAPVDEPRVRWWVDLDWETPNTFREAIFDAWELDPA